MEVLPQLIALRLKDKDPKLVLIDIRPADERKLASIPGDVHIPTENVEKEITKYKGKDVVLYCHHGVRSGILAEKLIEQGFTNVKSMAGGIDAWSDKVDKNIKKYGEEHKH